MLRSAFSAALAVALFLTTSLAMPVSARQAAAPTELDSIVAVVEEDVVLRSELDAELRKVTRQLQAQGAQVPPRPQLERQVLERLILLKLQLAAAQQLGVTVTDEDVDQALANVARNNNITLAQLREALARSGMSYDAYREDVRRQMIQGRLRQREVIEKIRVTDQEAQAFMARNPQFAEGGARTAYHILHILTATPEGATAEQIAAARAKAERLVGRLRAGASFREVARAESDARQALEGGDLGWLEAAQVPSIFIEQVERMRRGDISDPIRNAYGFNIIKLEDFRSSSGGGAGERRVVTQTRARHILLRTSETTSDADAQARLEALRERIANGEDFGNLARANSEDKVSAANGGELGWINPGNTVPQFEEQMDKLAPGQLSAPFRTPFGWHILQVEERRQVDSTDEVKLQQAKEQIRERKAEEATELFLRRLRDEAYVEIRLPVPEA
jgi:peptidyl-prolyl cis-trans isomerase SurA